MAFDEPGTLLILAGAAAALAGGMLRQLHFARITAHLKTHYPGLVDDLEGGRYRANPLILRNRVDRLLAAGRLQALKDVELDARVRIYRMSSAGIVPGITLVAVGVMVTLTGTG